MNDQASSGRELYDKFAKPLEAEHPGEFVAVSRDGRVLFGRDLYELVKQASKDFGPDNHVFKVGDRVLGKRR
jgi:hypothetical protein